MCMYNTKPKFHFILHTSIPNDRPGAEAMLYFWPPVFNRNRTINNHHWLKLRAFHHRKSSQNECRPVGKIKRWCQKKTKKLKTKKQKQKHNKNKKYRDKSKRALLHLRAIDWINPQLCCVYIAHSCSTSLKHKQIVNRPIGLLILHEFNKSETEWDDRADRTG